MPQLPAGSTPAPCTMKSIDAWQRTRCERRDRLRIVRLVMSIKFVHKKTSAAAGEMPKTALDAELSQKLYDAARQEFDEIDEQRVVAQQPAEEGKGYAKFFEHKGAKGAEYGTDDWNEATKNLTKRQKNVMGAVGEIAARFGYRVNLVNDPNKPDVYGMEDERTGEITINVANGFKHNMLVTMAHEMTHWLEQNSRQGYDDLRAFTLEALRNKGIDVQSRLVSIMDNYNMVMQPEAGQEMTVNGAMLELIAQSSEGLLSSRRAAVELQQTNPSLYGRVQTYVKNIVARLDAAIQDMGYESSMSQEAKALKEYREQLADIWFNARKDAQGKTPIIAPEEALKKDAEESNGSETHYSVVDKNEGTKKGSLTAAADTLLPALTSETTIGSSASGNSISEYEKYVNSKNAKEDSEEARMDQEYLQAILDKDEKKQLKMLREKLNNTKGIYPFYSASPYKGRAIQISKRIKNGDMAAISIAAYDMAKYVPDNAVLIPMPGHEGIVTDNTDTMLLAKELGRITGKPVLNALEGISRESRYAAKLQNKKGVTAEEMGFRKIMELPEGTIPMIIDNVVSVGETAKAAITAIPGSSVLSYTKGKSENVVQGLKAAFATKDREGKEYVPLSKKFDINNPDWRYSVAQLEDGTKYVEVDTEQERFDGMKPKDMLKAARQIIREKFIKTGNNVFELPDDEGKVKIDRNFADEYSYSSKRKMKEASKRAKGKVSTEIDNLIKTGVKLKPGDEHYPNESYGHKPKNMDYYSVLFRVNGRFFTGVLNIENTYNGKRLYDITQIKIDTSRSGLNRPTADNSTDIAASAKGNITQDNNNGKSFSLAQQDQAYMQDVEDGNVETQLLPSKRSEDENNDLSYSIAQGPDMEVNNFMMGLNEFNLPTTQEKTMLRQYKDHRTRIDLLRYAIRERENERKKLLAKDKRSIKENKRLGDINRFLERDRTQLDRMEKELVRITGSKGYARLMMQQADLMKNLVSGRTAGELEQTVESIQTNLDDVTREMTERAEKLKKLASADAVLKIRQQFNSRGLKQIAAKLKADLNSELDSKEIENRLALIALKMKEGKYDAETAEELSDLLAGRMQAEYDGYVISELRGSTITLGPSQLKELKESDRSLADIRAELAGTGIRIGTKGNTTLDEAWDHLCDVIASLDRNENSGNMLDKLLELIRSEKNMRPSVYSDENLMNVNRMVLEAAQKLIPEIVTDEKSLKLIRESLAFVSKLSGAAKTTAEAMEDINNLISRLQKKGEKAIVTAKKLTGDIGETIEYFDQLSLQSEAAMWKSERIRLIEQLKSENTRALMEEADRWREKIEKDKTYRETAGENLQTRKKITTNVSRIRKLLINETDLKNIPEHMKGLAREMLGMIVNNDLSGRKLTGFDPKDLGETSRILGEMRKLDGDFTPDDLRMLADEEAQAAVLDAMADLEEGIQEYNSHRKGSRLENAEAVRDTLNKISEAVSTITGVINAEREVSYWDRKAPVSYAAAKIRADMKNSRFKGEWTGNGSKMISAVKRSVGYGNTTPEYFMENLRNRGMKELWQDAQRGENRNGLETQKAKDRMAQLAAETNYKAWANETHDVVLGGLKRQLTIGNMMELYAIWKREQTENPEMSQHLTRGGIYIEKLDMGGKLRREVTEQRAVRVTDAEIQAMYDSMTEEQKKLIDGVVSYLSNEMSALGNEASMRMYGIKKYKEKYYFPMKVWDGVKSARSDKGITGTDENRMAHKSWSKRRQHMAQNALVIGDFMTDAVNHIVEMINYNTMAPSIENINKVLNYQFTEEAGTDEETKRNMRVLFQQAYGRDALNYLETLMKDMNGGVAQDQRKTLRDVLISTFKKNAVAGSMSVALQQPLSYIRAAMMINPKYMAQALSPAYWKGSFAEMMKYSGVAVIKEMGRFDMNFGQSAKDFITPETGKNAYEKISDALTIAPQLMDRMTWTRMWSAVKAEQAAQNRGADTTSDKFLNQVAERFNELMRKTQVYDSVLVKSANMRSNKWELKLLTSFMAEPTLSLNVLADALRPSNMAEKGGKAKAIKAGATFLASAILQAAVKGLMGSGRTPDKKKTWAENFLNKLQYNLMNEANPVSLIPGYGDLIEVLKKGELKDDAMGALGKLKTTIDTLRDFMNGKRTDGYRVFEDTVGQFAQLFTNIPAKNLMRDARAMYNWVSGTEYANRPTSSAVIGYQAEANRFNADNLMGVLNSWLGDAGFVTSSSRYYSRIYNAMKNGDEATAAGLREYLELGKGLKEESIISGIKKAAKSDDSMTEAQKDSWMISQGMMGKTNVGTVTTQYKEGKISAEEARKLWKELDPKLTDNDLWWKQDRADYQKETGAETVSGFNYRLKDAIASNKSEQINRVIRDLLKHGRTKEQIKDALSEWKSVYLEADAKERIRIRDALQKTYKAAGYTAADADKTIERWTKEKKKNK